MNSGVASFGWFIPIGLEAKKVKKSRYSRPLRESWIHDPWLFSTSSTISKPSTSICRPSEECTSEGAIEWDPDRFAPDELYCCICIPSEACCDSTIDVIDSTPAHSDRIRHGASMDFRTGNPGKGANAAVVESSGERVG